VLQPGDSETKRLTVARGPVDRTENQIYLKMSAAGCEKPPENASRAVDAYVGRAIDSEGVQRANHLASARDEATIS
jgi:hypothetical protein